MTEKNGGLQQGRFADRNGEVVTCGQAAGMIGCTARVVQGWVDSGTLPGFRLPPMSGKTIRVCGKVRKVGGDRRIYKDVLLAFMRNNKIRVPASLGGMGIIPVLLIGWDKLPASEISHWLPGSGGFLVAVAEDLMHAGILLGAQPWRGIVIRTNAHGRQMTETVAARFIESVPGVTVFVIGLEDDKDWNPPNTIVLPCHSMSSNVGVAVLRALTKPLALKGV